MSYSSKEEGSLGRVKELFSCHGAVFSYSGLEICSSKGAKASSDEWVLQKGEGGCICRSQAF